MKRAHGELRARVADRLRGDHPHGLAQIDGMSAAKIASIAHAAHTVSRLTRNRRTHENLVDTPFLDQRYGVLIEYGAVRYQYFLVIAGIAYIANHNPAENPVAQRDHDFTALHPF